MFKRILSALMGVLLLGCLLLSAAPARAAEQMYQATNIGWENLGYTNAYWRYQYSAPAGAWVTKVEFQSASCTDDYITDGTVYARKQDGSEVAVWSSTSNLTYYSGTVTLSGTDYVGIRIDFRAYDRSGTVSASPGGYVKVWYYVLDVPGKPQLSSSTSGVTAWNVKVSWTSGGNPSGTAYELWRRTLDANGNVVEDKCIYSGTALEFVTADQAQGKYYAYRVRAKYGWAYSGFSSETVFWTPPSGTASAGSGCINASWSKVMNGLTYRVHYRVSGGSWQERGTTTNLSATISGLTCANTYDVALSAVLPEGGPAWWSTLGTGIRPIPYAGKPSLGSAASAWQVAASWSAGSNPSGTTYELWRKTLNPDGSVAEDECVYSGTATGFTTTDQTSGRYYLFRVRASYGGVTSGFSAETSYWTAPGFSSVTPVAGGISLSWPKVKDGLTYRVMWLPEGGSWQSATTTSLSYTVSGLSPLVRYTVGLSAVLPEGGTEWRAGDTQVVPLAFAPGAGSLSATQTQVSASWGANGNPSGVLYYAELRDRAGSVLASSGWTASLSYTFSGLTPGTPYRVYVKAKNAAGVETSWTYLGECYTVPAKPAAPSGTFGVFDWSSSEGRGWVRLEWAVVQGATGYKVWVFDGNAYRAFDVGNRTYWDSREEKIYPSESALDSYGDNTQSGDLFRHDRSGLDLRDTPNKLYRKTVGTAYDSAHSYWFRVSAYNASGDSGYSDGACQVTFPNRTDARSPSGSLVVNEDQMVAGSPSVVVRVDASDPVVGNHTSDGADDFSGPLWVEFSNDGSSWSGKYLLDGGRNLVGASGADPFFRSLAGWQRVGPVAAEVCPGDGAVAGNSYVRLSWPDGGSGCDGLEPLELVPGLSPGQTYQVRVRYRITGLTQNAAYLWFHWRNTSTSFFQNADIYIDNAADGVWKELVVERTCPEGANAVYLKVGLDRPNAGAVLDVDYVQVTSVPASGPVDWTARVVAELPWKLDASAFGKKTVYARVTDGAGNVSAQFSDDIHYYLVDAQAPQVSLVVNGGAAVTSSTRVLLEVTARDDLTPATGLEMRLSDDFSSWTSWEPYRPYRDWTLSSGDGSKTVYVQVRDQSGNIGTAYARVVLRTSGASVQQSPAVFWSESGLPGQAWFGAQAYDVRWVKGTQVSVKLNAPGASYVQFSMDGMRWLSAEPVVAEKVFALPDWEGHKPVYARLSDGSVYVVHFVLDRTPPVVEAGWLGGATVAPGGQATLVVDARDNFSRQEDLQVSLDGGATWRAYAPQIPVSLGGSGYRAVVLAVKDQAGNVAQRTLGIFVP